MAGSDLLDGVPGVIWEASGRPDAADQRMDFVSSNVETLLGYSVQECLGTPTFWLSIVHPDDRAQVAAGATAAFARGEPHTAQFRWLAKDGRILWVEAHSTVVRNESGLPVGMRGVTFDITSRKQTEEALRQSLEDVTRMQQVSTRLLQAGDFSLLLQDILEAAIEITGADMGNIQLLEDGILRITAQRGFDRPFLEFFDTVHHNQAACGTALRSGGRVIVEDVANSPIFMGTPSLDVMIAAGARAVQATPLVSRSGRVLGMFSTHYRHAPQGPSERALRLLDILARQAADLIEQKRAEAALRTREAELELVINETPFMLTRCSRDMRYKFVSRTYAEMLGRRPADIAGKAIVDIMGEEGFETIRPYVERVLSGSRVEYESDVHFRGVGVRSLRAIYTPDADERGRVHGWIASILDITENKRAEEDRALLANIVDSSDDAIISKNLNEIITSWNLGAQRMFGYGAAEAIGQSITLIIPPDRLNEETEIQRALSEGRSVEHFETERITKGGRRLAVSLTISPVRNRDGTVIGASKIARDISDRVLADEERKRLLASEQAARARAEAASRAKDDFLATVSHELRTPLNAILAWAAMLEQAAPAERRTGKGLQSVHRNARALAQLVDDLLDVSRMISGKMHMNVGPIDLGDVVDAAVGAVLAAANAKDVRIHVVVDPASRPMVADATRLQQAVWNLLSNAVKFTPTGGRVEVCTRVDHGEVELAISDSGIGIDPAFLPYVFDRFRQADASSTRAHGGLGLGLAIVRHLVELHGGSVLAESAGRGAGSRFVVRLPCRRLPSAERETRRATARPVAPGSSEAAPLDNLRVLIVDDDWESCEVMMEALRIHGATVHAATSVNEAVRALPGFNPDLVLSDIAMPGRDGYAFLSEVRALEKSLGRHMPVMAVTAYARAEDRERAIAAGFDEYLSKPIELATLVALVRTVAAARG